MTDGACFSIYSGPYLSPEPPHQEGIVHSLKPSGWIVAECFDKHGKLRWRESVPNGIVNLGYNDMLNIMFVAATQLTTWYIGLISDSGYSALGAANTMASHSTWNESVAYSEGTRPQWTAGTSTAKSTTNSSTVNFSMTTDATVIKGIFVCSNSTKSGTGGDLWATGLFAADQTLNNGDILKVQYTVNLS